jgi:rod shape determining protein RodA
LHSDDYAAPLGRGSYTCAVGRVFLFDWPIVALGLLLSACGLVLVYSATWVPGEPPGPYFSDIFIKQVIAVAVSLVAFHFIRRIKWGIRPDSWLWFYLPVMLLLLIVLFVGHGMAHTGAQRWINLGFFKLQPSELAKVSWVMILAWFMSAGHAFIKANYIKAMAVLVSMTGLMLLQPDLGTSLVFIFSFLVVAFISPAPKRYLLITVACGLLLSVPAYFFVMKVYQQNRILTFLFKKEKVEVKGEDGLPLRDERGRIVYEIVKARPTEGDWQQFQGEIAVGSGGLTGKGFLRGTQNQGQFVPAAESDFIFAIVAEEFGFFGSAFILILYFLLIARILALSRDAQTTYERYICYGASAVLLFHVFVAAGMTMRLTPVTGVPLPFLSQGGSSMLAFWIMLAVLESIYEKSQGEFGRSRPAAVVRRR